MSGKWRSEKHKEEEAMRPVDNPDGKNVMKKKKRSPLGFLGDKISLLGVGVLVLVMAVISAYSAH